MTVLQEPVASGAIDRAADYAGTGIFDLLGFDLPDSAPGQITGYLTTVPGHRNRMGFVHGGVLATMIDAAACGSGLYSEPGKPKRYGMTLSLSVQFVSAVRDGRLTVRGRQVSGGRRVFTAEAHVYDERDKLVANGIGTFQWLRGSEPGNDDDA